MSLYGASPQGVYNVSLDLYGVEADSPEEALRLFLDRMGITPPAGTLFVVTNDETGEETEIDYQRSV